MPLTIHDDFWGVDFWCAIFCPYLRSDLPNICLHPCWMDGSIYPVVLARSCPGCFISKTCQWDFRDAGYLRARCHRAAGCALRGFANAQAATPCRSHGETPQQAVRNIYIYIYIYIHREREGEREREREYIVYIYIYICSTSGSQPAGPAPSGGRQHFLQLHFLQLTITFLQKFKKKKDEDN